MSCENKDQRELFDNMMKNCGIGIGDKVKVVAKVPSYHMGWETAWAGQMDKHVGSILTVQNIYDGAGFLCTPGNWYYPPQALQLVEKKEEEKVCVPTPKHGDIVVDGCHGRKLLIIADTRAVGGFYAYTDDGEIWCGKIACVDLHYANGYYKKQENVFDKSC